MCAVPWQLRDTGHMPTGIPFYDSVAIGEYNDDCHHLTVCDYPEYLQTRVQFGRPIATNQALKFRMVEMHYALEEARSLTAGAIHALAGERGAARAMVWCRATGRPRR